MQLKSLSTYGLQGSVATKDDNQALVTLVTVKPCGLDVPDKFKGLASTENVAAYKRLEAQCGKSARRTAELEEYGPLPPLERVQLSPRTTLGFKKTRQQQTGTALNGDTPLAPKYQTKAPHEMQQSLRNAADTVPLGRRQGGDWNRILKTHEDIVLTSTMDKIDYMDPLGPGNGYADAQHRFEPCL